MRRRAPLFVHEAYQLLSLITALSNGGGALSSTNDYPIKYKIIISPSNTRNILNTYIHFQETPGLYQFKTYYAPSDHFSVHRASQNLGTMTLDSSLPVFLRAGVEEEETRAASLSN